MPDRFRCISSVNAIDRCAEIHRPRAEWGAGAAGHPARQIRLSRNHLRRRHPIGPFALERDLLRATPLETLAPNADAVAKRARRALHQIQVAVGRENNDRTRRVITSEIYWLLAPLILEA